MDTVKTIMGWIAAIAVCVMLCLGSVVGGCGVLGVVNNWHRNQARKNAENRVSITKINIQNEQAQARVVAADNGVIYAQGQQRIITAKAIRQAQRIVANSLTPWYLEYDAIEAQKAIATSGQNNTVVYVPSGSMGVPLVQDATHPSAFSNSNPLKP